MTELKQHKIIEIGLLNLIFWLIVFTAILIFFRDYLIPAMILFLVAITFLVSIQALMIVELYEMLSSGC